MPQNNSKRWYLLAAGALVTILVAAGLLKLRYIADGWSNAFSPRYWSERRAGVDLYNPSENYLKRGSREIHSVLLTFDDGPFPSSAGQILDILKREQVHATFFVVGKRVKVRPDLVKRMIDEGHEVGNHTQDHLRLDSLTPKQVANELGNCETNVERATSRRMTLFRPPGMRFNTEVINQIRAKGYTMIGYNVGAKDFTPDRKLTDMTSAQTKSLKSTPDLIASRVLEQVKDGVIILLHDNPSTVTALPKIIDGLKAEGFTFKTSQEFLQEIPQKIEIVSNPPAPSHIAVIPSGTPIR